MKLIGSSPMAAPRRMAAVPLNSALFFSIQLPTPASDQVKPPSRVEVVMGARPPVMNARFSDALLAEIKERNDLEVLSGPHPLGFSDQGDLVDTGN